MKKHSVLVHIMLLSIFFALFHIVALNFSLYWTTSTADIFMHGFGGFLGSLLVIYVLQKIGIFGTTTPRKILLFLFVCVSVVAVGAIWELWEIFVGFTDPFTDILDTIMDLIMDTFGAIIGFVYYDKKLKPKTE
jgi:hypothetical protein